jgi:autotransporter-associated beta strand protein
VQNGGSLGTGTVTIGTAATGANNLALYLSTNRANFTAPVVVTNNGTGTVTLGSRVSITGTGDNNQFTNITLQRDVIFDSHAADRTDYENISGAGNITITGTGRSIILGTNPFVGNVTVSLTGSAAAAVQLGVVSAGNQNFIPDSANVTVNDAVGNTGAELRLSSGGESINALDGNGTIDVNGINGTLTVGAANGSAIFTGVMQNGGASVFSFGKSGTGTQTLTGANTYTGTTAVNGGTLQIGEGGQLGAGAVSLAAGTTLAYNRAGAVTQTGGLNGAVIGAGTLNVDGGVALTLNGAGNFSGVINVNNGTLIYGATNPTNTAVNAPTMNLAAGTTLTTGTASTHAHIGNLTMNGATWTTGAGTGTYNTENFQLNGTVTIAGTTPSVITREASRTDANSGIAFNGVRTFNVGDVTNSSAPDLTVSTELENSDTTPADDGFIKTGAGTMVLANLNSYSGPTTLNAGTILLTGSLSATSSVTIAGGELTLGSENSINNAAALNLAGGTFDTGDFNATLGLFTLGGSATVDLGGASSILRLANSSAATWLGGSILTIDGWDGLTTGNGDDQVFFGIDATGLDAGKLAAIRFLNPDGFAPGIYNAEILPTGELVAVPEPASVSILLGGFGALLALRRRRNA